MKTLKFPSLFFIASKICQFLLYVTPMQAFSTVKFLSSWWLLLLLFSSQCCIIHCLVSFNFEDFPPLCFSLRAKYVNSSCMLHQCRLSLLLSLSPVGGCCCCCFHLSVAAAVVVVKLLLLLLSCCCC